MGGSVVVTNRPARHGQPPTTFLPSRIFFGGGARRSRRGGRLDGLDHYRYFHSARADLLRRAGRDDEARHAYQRALELAQTDAERRSLNEQLGKLKRPRRPFPDDGDAGRLPAIR
jgi:hypothetical protein